MMKKQHYMTRDERYQLEAYLKAGKTVSWIAREMGFCERTIYYEKKRGAYEHECMWNTEIRYSADKAQQVHRYNQTAKGRPLKIGNDRTYAEFLERKILTDRFSPAAALAAARKAGHKTSVCVSTLYSYIDKGIFLHLTNKALWVKSKKRKRSYEPVRRIAHPNLPSISTRCEEIAKRKEYGHWEMDLIVGKAGTRAVLLTLTERKTRQELIYKLPDRRAATIRGVFDRLERKTPHFREKFRSITTDNGPEFLEYELLRKSACHKGSRFEVYYCHSYAAWEKGSNENHNRMIRRFFPKGTDFTRITKKQIQAVQDWMNHYPRKILNWYTPAEAA